MGISARKISVRTPAVSGIDIEDEGGSVLVAATTLDFLGAGVSAADGGGGKATVTIPGGISGIDVEDEGGAVNTATIINFVGPGVTATDAGGGEATATIPGAVAPTVTVVTAAGPYNVTGSDEIIIINQTVGAAITVNLPAIGTTGRELIIKDGKGDAGTNNITIDGNGAETIDGLTTQVLNGDYWSLSLVDNGTEWSVT